MLDAQPATATKTVTETLDKCSAANPHLDAFVELMPESAQATAAYLDAMTAAGVSVGPLHGVPIAAKDIIDVAGRPTRAGSATRVQIEPAAADAFVVAKLRAAGAVVVGKTKTVEFAFGGWGTNESSGTPKNPWDPKVHRTPGGSSSGTGVAVGGGLVSAGLGTDTGGSVRIPAAFCGCVGLKTSIGLVSRSGVVPLSETFDTVGPLTSNVRLAAEMLAVMQGEDRHDPSTVGISRKDPLADIDRGIAGLRFARLPDEQMAMMSGEVRAAFEQSLQLLADAGATIGQMTLPLELLEIQQRLNLMIATEAYSTYSSFADDPASPLNDPTRMRMLAGRDVSAKDRVLAQRKRAEAVEDFAVAIDRFDALVLPAAPITPIPVADVDETLMPMSLYTRLANYMGLASLVVPSGLTSGGMPTSLQIVVRHLDDPLALRIGLAFETLRGPFATPPAYS